MWMLFSAFGQTLELKSVTVAGESTNYWTPLNSKFCLFHCRITIKVNLVVQYGSSRRGRSGTATPYPCTSIMII